MKDLREKIEQNYLLGYIKFNDVYSAYLMPIAWWILNYKKYYPDFDPSKYDAVFRDNILNVSDDQVANFIHAIRHNLVEIDEIKHLLDSDVTINFFVDFDAKIYVNGLFDNIEVETYLPDEGWKGVEDFPVNYLSDDISR
jgi:hypothetical protein